ncbi:hypothetical protein MKZ38_003778 [Zalerion maritima]|uniref:Zn(2)-C6 fungal-type domain-containing protein n=1 Tax=Zalerion maritima TaxID=339359 RepID=A0AAD5WRK7_9PEZI|nr:hypothetical protein MKZ38_003778 [Zalerion maritima]
MMNSYGKACTSCSKAKCRCVYPQEGENCERCTRLGRTCTPSATRRKLVVSPRESHRKSASVMPSTCRDVPLGEKLDRLVTLLSNQQARITVNTPSSSPAAGSSSISGTGAATPSSVPSHTVSAGQAPEPSVSVNSNDAPPQAADSLDYAKSFSSITIPPEEAQTRLRRFRDDMLPFFPVLHLPSTLSSPSLRSSSPFLWLCVMCVSGPTISQQTALGASIKKVVAEELVLNNRKNMDFLLGLLIFLGWTHHQVSFMSIVSHFTLLAHSLLFDLGLNKKHVLQKGNISFRRATQSKPPVVQPVPAVGRARTMEDKRAVVGCWFLSSSIAILLKRIDGLKWTTTMDECLDSLLKNPECPGDVVLGTQVSLQLLTEQLDMSCCTWPFGNSLYAAGEDSSLSGESFQRSQLFIDTILARFEKIKAAVPVELSGNEVLQFSFYRTHILIHETLLTHPPHPGSQLSSSRCQAASACLSSIKSFFASFFTLDAGRQYVGLAFLTMCELAYTLMVLARFSTTEDAAWDRAAVRREADLIDTCDMLVQSFSGVARARAQRGGRGGGGGVGIGQGEENHQREPCVDIARGFKFMRELWRKEVHGGQTIPHLASDAVSSSEAAPIDTGMGGMGGAGTGGEGMRVDMSAGEYETPRGSEHELPSVPMEWLDPAFLMETMGMSAAMTPGMAQDTYRM